MTKKVVDWSPAQNFLALNCLWKAPVRGIEEALKELDRRRLKQSQTRPATGSCEKRCQRLAHVKSDRRRRECEHATALDALVTYKTDKRLGLTTLSNDHMHQQE
ncbi:unnamed protein product [Protopolystoma xenopodis]|uniref:Uncharacterized protein n=1 Tax=Protopolystoma xenopodis TaxID=117903 RepID=A0A448XLB3_9PLAT|nr:unnamed protein product [Protopolystoma xenopodis]